MLAIGLGVGLVVLREVLDKAIHGVRELTAIMGEAPLVSIPYIENDVDIIGRRRNWALGLASLAVVALISFYVTYSVIQ